MGNIFITQAHQVKRVNPDFSVTQWFSQRFWWRSVTFPSPPRL